MMQIQGSTISRSLNHSCQRSQYYTGLRHALLSFDGSMTDISVRLDVDEQMVYLRQFPVDMTFIPKEQQPIKEDHDQF